MVRPDPDRMALEIAHRATASLVPLDEMLKDPAQTAVLKCLARRHMQRRARPDVKKLQAHDND